MKRSSASRLARSSVQALWVALGLNIGLFFAAAVAGLLELADDDILAARNAPVSVGAVVLATAVAILAVTILGWILMRSSRRPSWLFGRLIIVFGLLSLLLPLRVLHYPLGIRVTLALMHLSTTAAAWQWIRPAIKRRRLRGGSSGADDGRAEE